MPVITAATGLRRAAEKDLHPLVRESLRSNIKLETLAGDAAEAERNRRTDYNARAAVVRIRVDAADDLVGKSTHALTSRFGGNGEGSRYSTAGRRRWLEGQRRAIAKHTASFTGISDALRPISAS
jgi:hypothetical protein